MYSNRRHTKRNKKHHTTKKRKLKLIQGSSALAPDIKVDKVELIRQRGLMEDERLRRKIEKERQERKQHIEHAKDAIRQNTGIIAMENYADINKNLSEREEMNKKIADEYFSHARAYQKESEKFKEKYGEEVAKRDEANKKWDRRGLLSFRKKGDTKEMKEDLKKMDEYGEAAAKKNSMANAVLRDFNKQVKKKRKINDEKMEKIIASRMGAKLGGKTKKKRRRRTKKKRRKRRKSRKKRRRSRRRRRR